MNRTLHVIDQPGQTAEAAVLRLSVDAVTHENSGQAEQHAWLLFGGQATRDAARAVGLHDDQFRLLPRPAGLHKLLPAAMAKPKQLMSRAHRVVCWTEGATQIASLLGCAHVVRRVQDATLSRIAHHIIKQATRDALGPAPKNRELLRERWGVERGTTVIALIGDRFDRIDASAAMMTIALTHEALRATLPERADVHLLCHPLDKRRSEAAELSNLLKLDRLLMQDERIALPWEVLPSCDVALVPCPGEAGLSMLWADAMGVPVIAPRDARLPMLDGVQHAASRSSKPRDLADALTKWIANQSQPALR